MKKRLTMLLILIAIVCSSLILTNIKLLPVARATYVEGPITQDTTWTLVESPFVLANNVIVYPNATLTIEPGVEVTFGGNFSLIVSGKLYADGAENTINFTSNKITPGVGDWDAIKFNGTAKSTLIGCFIAYATNGILVENGSVEIENSTISLCQNGIRIANSTGIIQNSTISLCQNGIRIANSTGIIQNSMIAENQENGITVTGSGQVTLENNTIMANGNGILLTGTDGSNVSIRWNKISANNNSGIQIDAVNHTSVTNNIVSSNGKGFYILSPTSTYLTNNSISYNDVGVLYTNGSHTAIYNDIYNNEMGMDVQFNATVDAEHNYWGDPSGPYNPSLNPYGKGNAVGGNGTNLDFIFWLTKPIEYINQRPIANLLTDKVTVQPNETVMFFATNSYDPNGTVDEYFFDFGDGTNSSWTTLSIFTHKYLLNGTYDVNLTVMDDYGTTSIPVTTKIYVQNLPLLNVDLILNNSTVQEGGQVSLTAKVTYGNTNVSVENATVTMFSVMGEPVTAEQFTPSSGSTNASGYFVSTFTALNVTELTNVRIVATASKIGYADNSDYKYLQILPYLVMEISASPNAIKSQGTATIIVYVKSYAYGNPIANVSVTVSSNVGKLNPQSGMTDSNGVFAPVFTAPQTTTSMNATITAVATKSNYIISICQMQLPIEPEIPVVQITTTSNTTFSETKLAVTVNVEYDMLPLSGSNVTITADNGNFSTTTGLTGTYGNVTFNFTSPLVNKETNITITAKATDTGYAEAQNELKIAVEPKTFSVQIIAPQTISGEPNDISVLVRCKEDNTTVANATVIISSTAGNFSETTKTTDQDGVSAFTFNAPLTKSQLLIPITVNVTKNGYTDGASETTITVVPETISKTGGGWPLTTILLILIPILVVVIVVLLIKLKIVSISFEEEKPQGVNSV